MAQLVSLCLTSTGTTTLSNIDIYSDYLGGWTLIQSGVQVSAMTGNNCPYVFIAPDGTNNVKLIDEISRCTVTLNLQSGDFCSTCNLNLSSFSASATTISAGNLTGTCQSNITDYQINWYGPDSTTNLAFQSGKGTTFLYDIQHPFSNAPALGGTYKPVINKIILSGITFSSTGGTGEVLSSIDCLSGLTVVDCNCGNGNTTGDYSHTVNFTSSSNGKTPTGLTQKFLLSSDTQYFALSFSGLSVFDTLKITFSGSNYSNPIVLENMRVGNDAGTIDVNPTTIPRRIQAQFYKKVLCLTGLTKTTGDYLLFEVTPNPSNNNTSWRLDTKCLSSFDCENCFKNLQNQSYKIVSSSISSTTGECGTNAIQFSISGCSNANLSSTDVGKYLLNIGSTTFNTNIFWGTFRFSLSGCSQSSFFPPNPDSSCVSTGGTITLSKTYSATTGGTYLFSFTNFTDFKAFKDAIDSIRTFSGSTDPFNTNYYRRATLRFLTPANNSTNGCGDNFNIVDYSLHPATVSATTATTITGYTLEVIQPQLSAQTLFTSCQLNCQSTLNGYVSGINSSSQALQPTLFTTVGLRLKNPFLLGFQITGPSSTSFTGSTSQSLASYFKYGNVIYPYSGTSTIIPSLSAVTCDYIEKLSATTSNNTFSQQSVFYGKVEITNPLDIRDFNIYVSPITNYVYSGFPSSAVYELAYSFSGGSVIFSNPNYII